MTLAYWKQQWPDNKDEDADENFEHYKEISRLTIIPYSVCQIGGIRQQQVKSHISSLSTEGHEHMCFLFERKAEFQNQIRRQNCK